MDTPTGYWTIYDKQLIKNNIKHLSIGEEVDPIWCDPQNKISSFIEKRSIEKPFAYNNCLAYKEEKGKISRAFLGKKDNTPVYGELCAHNTNGFFPESADINTLSFSTNNIEKCGCKTIIEGSGCYKANDTEDLTYFIKLD